VKWLILGALLGLLLALAPAAVATVALHPLTLAFTAGLLARPHLARRMRGWTV